MRARAGGAREGRRARAPGEPLPALECGARNPSRPPLLPQRRARTHRASKWHPGPACPGAGLRQPLLQQAGKAFPEGPAVSPSSGSQGEAEPGSGKQRCPSTQVSLLRPPLPWLKTHPNCATLRHEPVLPKSKELVRTARPLQRSRKTNSFM